MSYGYAIKPPSHQLYIYIYTAECHYLSMYTCIPIRTLIVLVTVKHSVRYNSFAIRSTWLLKITIFGDMDTSHIQCPLETTDKLTVNGHRHDCSQMTLNPTSHYLAQAQQSQLTQNYAMNSAYCSDNKAFFHSTPQQGFHYQNAEVGSHSSQWTTAAYGHEQDDPANLYALMGRQYPVEGVSYTDVAQYNGQMTSPTSHDELAALFSPFPEPSLSTAAPLDRTRGHTDAHLTWNGGSQLARHLDSLSPSLDAIPELDLDLLSNALQDTADSSSGVFSNDSRELDFLLGSSAPSVPTDIYIDSKRCLDPRRSPDGGPLLKTAVPVLNNELSPPAAPASSPEGMTTTTTTKGSRSDECQAGKDKETSAATNRLICLVDQLTDEAGGQAVREVLPIDGSSPHVRRSKGRRRNVKKSDGGEAPPTDVVQQSNSGEQIGSESKPKPKLAEKLGISYINLLARAILSSGEKRMLLNDIYSYILEQNPFFRSTTCAWRNSVRYTLSVNECFMKDGRSTSGRGYYWAIHPACLADFIAGDFNRRNARRRVQETNKRLEDSIKQAKACQSRAMTPPGLWYATQASQRHLADNIGSNASPVHLVSQTPGQPHATHDITSTHAARSWVSRTVSSDWSNAGGSPASGHSASLQQTAPTPHHHHHHQVTPHPSQDSLRYSSQTQVWLQANPHGLVFYA